VSYFLFSPPGFLWELSKTHITLTTHPWFFPENVFHKSYPRGNTNNMSSYFLLIFPLGFYRSFSGISLYIAPHIFFPEKVFEGVIYMSYLQYLFSTGFLMGYDIVVYLNHTRMLFSPYFPIRFKGVFMTYLYIHIPQIFPKEFFEESKLTAALISRKIRSKGKFCEMVSPSEQAPTHQQMPR
jgi:hypothetical protein